MSSTMALPATSLLPVGVSPTEVAGVAPSLIADPNLCTLQTCPLVLANMLYVPTLPGNALYAGIFGLLIITQIFFGIRYRTWGFLGGMFGGVILEIIGYIGRLQMHNNPFTQPPFLTYLVCLTIGPTFLSASIYLCLARIVVVYGEHLSRFKPRTYTLTFISFDFCALLLQAIGGAIASTASGYTTTQMGINIMVAGVSWQVASLAFFAILCAEFAWRVRQNGEHARNQSPDFISLRHSFFFKAFIFALGVATLTIFIRSLFRCAELSAGFHGALANNELTFMVLEGAMIIIAVSFLTVFHPGLSFQGKWNDAGWNLRMKKNVDSGMTEKTSTRRKWGWKGRGRTVQDKNEVSEVPGGTETERV